MHWARCKLLHNSSFIIKTRWFDPNVFQGTPPQLPGPWDRGVRAICFQPLLSFTQWLLRAQLWFHWHWKPTWYHLITAHWCQRSNLEIPINPDQKKNCNCSQQQLCSYIADNCKDLPGLVSRAQLHWKCLSQPALKMFVTAKVTHRFLFGYISSAELHTKTYPKAFWKEIKGGHQILTGRKHFHQNLRICL